ncbi:uncharacterized protein LOC120839989 [Ixodes scapularis]|uniref:uncharacterized protein LOC120839989 n=1 Tax=Ixodes scapularis TaxID=6945 RepID=UPI001A9E38AA|nr:uncharacterized protein LOC120839989 [Ixodes scapularis]
MERLKAKRGVKRSQNTKIIHEAIAGMETADLASLTAWLERLKANNRALQELNVEIEDHISEQDLVAEYTTVTEYDDEAIRMMALLDCKADSLRRKEQQAQATQMTTSATTSASATTDLGRNRTNMTSGVKLPKLLQTFNGEYLRNHVTGPAAAAIAGLQATEACYDDAIEILTLRFGDKRRIEQNHLAKLRALPPVASAKDTKGLRKMYDHVQTNIRGLKGLGVRSATYCTMMSDILLKALPSEVVVNYHRQQASSTAYRSTGETQNSPTSLTSPAVQDTGHFVDGPLSTRSASRPPFFADAEDELADILSFLRIEVESRERAGVVEERQETQKKKTERPRMPATSVLHANITSPCFFCRSTKHATEVCTGDLTLEVKKKRLAEENRCFRCTIGEHRARECRRKVTCASCSGRHATSMCDPNWKPNVKKSDRGAPATSVQNAISDSADVPLDSEVLLQTFRAWAEEGNQRLYVQAIIDGGSQRTFIREGLSRKLGLKVLGYVSLRLNTFGHSTSRPQRRRLVQVRLHSQYGQEECVIEAVEVPFICKDVVQVPVDHEFVRRMMKNGRRIADMLLSPLATAEEGISLLVGSDQLWRVNGDQVLHCKENQKLVAISIIFGWTFQGPVSNHSSLKGSASSMVCVLRTECFTNEDVGDILRRFWELESIGISDQPSSKMEEQNELLNEFNRTIRKVNGRIWEQGIGWDDDLTDDLLVQWRRWCAELPQLEEIVIPRCIVKTPREVICSLQLHVFCDGSPVAYGTCAYLRAEGEDGKFSFEELTTMLQEVEAVVNSRPLAPVNDAPHEQEALTPAHFLLGRRLTAFPSVNLETIPGSARKDITRRWLYRQQLLDRFWRRWRKEYLLQLRSAHRSPETRTNDLQNGDLVLVHEDKTPRLMWKTGRIETVQLGRDNHVRSCLVRLPSGVTLRRPVQLLYPLELASE